MRPNVRGIPVRRPAPPAPATPEDASLLLLDVPRVAKRLCVGEYQVRRYIWDGKLEHVRMGRLVRVTPEALARFVAGLGGSR